MHYDKWLHVGAFALLAVLIMWSINALSLSPRAGRMKRFCASPITVFSLLAAYGLFDELTQTLSGRHFNLYDWAADLAGAGIGILFLLVVNYLRLDRVTAPAARDD